MDFTDIDALNRVGDSKYSTCIALAKRARELGLFLTAKKNIERINIIPPLVDTDSEDPFEIALIEIKEGKVSFTKQKNNV